jgi:hypothetical protein
MSQVDLARLVLGDTRVALPGCERAAIASGSVARPALAALELLALHGVRTAVSGAWCASPRARAEAPLVLRTGNAIALEPGGATTRTSTALAVAVARALNPLSGAQRPAISTSTAPGEVVVSFAPTVEPAALAASAAFTGGFALSGSRWSALDARLARIAEPRIPTASSAAALPDPRERGSVHAARNSP